MINLLVKPNERSRTFSDNWQNIQRNVFKFLTYPFCRDHIIRCKIVIWKNIYVTFMWRVVVQRVTTAKRDDEFPSRSKKHFTLKLSSLQLKRCNKAVGYSAHSVSVITWSGEKIRFYWKLGNRRTTGGLLFLILPLESVNGVLPKRCCVVMPALVWSRKSRPGVNVDCDTLNWWLKCLFIFLKRFWDT